MKGWRFGAVSSEISSVDVLVVTIVGSSKLKYSGCVGGGRRIFEEEEEDENDGEAVKSGRFD